MEAEKEKKAKKNGKKKAIIISVAALCLVAIGVAVFFFFFGRNPMSATTMRILRYEGSVSLFDNDKENTLMENMLLHSGNVLATQDASYIDISLDDSKVVGLDEASRAEFNQSGKKLDISLVNGGLYFYTTEKLKDDETFDIRTSTMIIGIRGTSGYVRADEETGVTTLQLTSGKVHIEGTNPVTGGKRETDITAGQSVKTYFYNDRQGEDSIEFIIDSFDEEDLPVYYVKSLVEQPDVLKAVVEESGLSEEKLREIAQTDTEEVSEEEDSEEQNEETEDAEEEPEEEEAEEEPQENQQTNAANHPAVPAAANANTAAANPSETTTNNTVTNNTNTNDTNTNDTNTNDTNTNDTNTNDTNTNDTNTPAENTDDTGNTNNTDNNSTDPEPSNEEENDNNTETDTYTVTADTATGGTVTASPSDAKEGDVVTLTATPQSGYELDAWSVKDSSGNAISVSENSANNTATFTMPAGNVSVSATFKEASVTTYRVSTTTATGGTVTTSPSDAKEGDVVTLTATPQSGYELDAWSVKDSSGNAITVGALSSNGTGSTATFTMPAGNVTVSATFKETVPATYNIKTHILAGGTVTSSATTAVEGATVTLTATPQSGYELDSWSVQDSSGNQIAFSENRSNNTATISMPASDVTVSATFKEIATYRVNVSSSITGGAIAASVATAVKGTLITLTATPDTGYELDKWNVQLSDGNTLVTEITPDNPNKATFTMPAYDVTVSATMKKKSYSIESGTTTGLASIQFQNGSVSEVMTAQMGDTVTVLMELESGRRITDITIEKSDGTAVSHSAISTDSATGYKKASFTMPAGDVTVSVKTADAVFGIGVPDEITLSVPSAAELSVNFESYEARENNVVSGYIYGDYFTSFEVKVKKSDGEIVESVYSDNELSFIMPDDDVTICLEGVVSQMLTPAGTLSIYTTELLMPYITRAGVYYTASGTPVMIAGLTQDASGEFSNADLGIYIPASVGGLGAADIMYSYEGNKVSVSLLNTEGTKVATLTDDGNNSTCSATLPKDDFSQATAQLKLIWNKEDDEFTLDVTE
ncbi:MAG: FecR domain-containing protein [Lachnospiraceae bacterium]|nr:FecR domain-containing protein [Lachnospiraceae bacterium]